MTATKQDHRDRIERPPATGGWVNGHAVATAVGHQVLAEGGNAIDAAVAAGLAACIAAPRSCGIGGYGGCATVALAGTGRVTCIDFNTLAPAAAHGAMFKPDRDGQVPGEANRYGWRAAGVPGTLDGFDLLLRRHGTRSFGEMLQPAIKLARDGIVLDRYHNHDLRKVGAALKADPASAGLLFKNGHPPRAGTRSRNPDLAAMLERLAADNSVAAFYRGDIARQIVAASRRGGGKLTLADLAACRAREVKPHLLAWGDYTIATAPVPAGGFTVLQALNHLKHLGADTWPAGPERTHAWLEALRCAWRDRLTRLGDPTHVDVPARGLLSAGYAKARAREIRSAVDSKVPLEIDLNARPQGGTMNVAAGDAAGNLVTITFTHGAAYGACVTVEGLGLTLGHGMALFDPRPGWPNSPGPRKRPLHNMCPIVLLRGGVPVLAAGACGGRRIPNAMFSLLAAMLVDGKSFAEAMAAPRLYTIGNRDVELESHWPVEEQRYLRKLGFHVRRQSVGLMNGVAFDPATRQCTGAMR